MAKLKTDIWKTLGWERGDQIPGGNQGHTHRARKSTDPDGVYGYVLKKLKRQEEPDRRAMFCNEVRAMDVLDHPGVIRVAATNAESFREDVELFLITPLIDGADLDCLAKGRRIALEDAVRITLAVLRILDHCHKRGVVHRDIKPCHVILRYGSLDDPVLIDFGLAYNRDAQPSDAETVAGQGKGNRFLIGPEHLAENPDANRSPVTDICQCIGLLFYAITQKQPGLLQDKDGKKPHERLAEDLFGHDVCEWKRKAVVEIFNVGFEWHPDRRWQTIDHLARRLEAISCDNEPTDLGLESELARIIRSAETSSHTVQMKDAVRMAEEIVRVVRATVTMIDKKVEKFLAVECGPRTSSVKTVGRCGIVFKNKIDSSKSRAISVVIELSSANRIDVSLRPYNGNLSIFKENLPVALGSYDLGTAECSDRIRPLIVPYLTQCVSEVLGVDNDGAMI